MTGEDTTSDRDGHGMGDERNSGFPDRRPAPGPPGPEPASGGGPLEALLAVALRGDKADGEAELRAVAAFRVARDTGAHRARTRRRDDWRPRARRRTVRSLRTTLCVLLASLTLGGVAYAAIGGDLGRGEAGKGHVRPSVAASTPAEAHSSSRPSVSAAPAGRPPTAQNTLAHCRVYEKLRDRGKAPDATAFRRLVTAAGGEADVSAYCAALTAGTATNGADGAEPGKRKAEANANAGNNGSDKKSRKR
ncbi:hypothetical protein OHT57_31210 [Streptomyces sp. NBC_00285]|uniref:hypothetical protein n=1 Tax=Streptomyces sp. NBC_00285 TaxID=2975700 RepID=UPI002E2E64D2|nr:hypothetical protein [Streptomyces sp. NBC_00285]